MVKTEEERDREDTIAMLKQVWGEKVVDALDTKQMAALVTFMEGFDRLMLKLFANQWEIKTVKLDESGIIDKLISHGVQEGMTVTEFLDDLLETCRSIDAIDPDEDDDEDDLSEPSSAYLLTEEMSLTAFGPNGVIGVRVFPFGSIFFEPPPEMGISSLTMDFDAPIRDDDFHRVAGYSHETQRCYALPRQCVVRMSYEDGMKLIKGKAEQDQFNSLDYNAYRTVVFKCRDQQQMLNLDGIIERMIELMPGVEIVEHENGDHLTVLETVHAIVETSSLTLEKKYEVLDDLLSNVNPHMHDIKEYLREQHKLEPVGGFLIPTEEDEESE